MSLDINQIALHQLIKRDAASRAGVAAIHCWNRQKPSLRWWQNCIGSIAPKIKLTACLAKRVNWRRRCAYSVRVKRTFLAFSRAATGRLRDELAKYPC